MISGNFEKSITDIQKPQKPDQLKELEDLMRRMDNLKNEPISASTVPNIPSNSNNTVSTTYKQEPPFDIGKYLKQVNATISTVHDAKMRHVQKKSQQKSEREMELKDLLRRMNNLQNAPVQALLPFAFPTAQPVSFVNNYEEAASYVEKKNTSSQDVDQSYQKL